MRQNLAYFVVPLKPSAAELYALQMPGYPLAFAGWCTLFGFGWRQAFAFDAIIHVALCALTATTASRFVRAQHRGLAWLGALLMMFGGSSGRPDELSMCVGLGGLLILIRWPGVAAGAVVGLLAVLAAFTSPVGALCMALSLPPLIALDEHSDSKLVMSSAVAAAVSASVFGLGAIAIILAFWPAAWQQFSMHAASVREHRSLAGNIRWIWRFSKWVLLAPMGIVFGSVIATVGIYLTERQIRWLLAPSGMFLACTLIFFQFHSPFYLWFIAPAGVIVISAVVSELLMRRQRWPVTLAILVVFGATAAGSAFDLLRSIGLAIAPPGQSWRYNVAQLRRQVPDHSRVLADEHWFSMAERCDVYDANFSTVQALEKVDYVILTGNGSGTAGARKILSGDCEEVLQRDFVEIFNGIDHDPLKIGSLRISNSSCGMGYSLLQRRAASRPTR